MELNLSVIIACGTAITAIIAPVFTAIVNNRYQLKMKTIDMFYKEKSDIYQRFCIALEYLDSWVLNLNDDIVYDELPSNEYLRIHKLTYLISNDEIRGLLDKLSSYFNEPAINENKYEVLKREILKAMNKDLRN